MKVFKIPVVYEMYGFVSIETETLEDAIEIALHDNDVPLPDDPSYVEGSFALGCEYGEVIDFQ